MYSSRLDTRRASPCGSPSWSGKVISFLDPRKNCAGQGEFTFCAGVTHPRRRLGVDGMICGVGTGGDKK